MSGYPNQQNMMYPGMTMKQNQQVYFNGFNNNNVPNNMMNNFAPNGGKWWW